MDIDRINCIHDHAYWMYISYHIIIYLEHWNGSVMNGFWANIMTLGQYGIGLDEHHIMGRDGNGNGNGIQRRNNGSFSHYHYCYRNHALAYEYDMEMNVYICYDMYSFNVILPANCATNEIGSTQPPPLKGGSHPRIRTSICPLPNSIEKEIRIFDVGLVT